jgi:hypothetical protein
MAVISSLSDRRGTLLKANKRIDSDQFRVLLDRYLRPASGPARIFAFVGMKASRQIHCNEFECSTKAIDVPKGGSGQETKVRPVFSTSGP